MSLLSLCPTRLHSSVLFHLNFSFVWWLPLVFSFGTFSKGFSLRLGFWSAISGYLAFYMSLFSVAARLPYLNRSAGKIGVNRILYSKMITGSLTLYYQQTCCNSLWLWRWLPHRLSKRPCQQQHSYLVFKCLTGCASAYLTSMIVKRSAVSTRTTWNSEMLRIPLFRTASGQRSFEYRATSLWKKLQPELKLSESVKSFKRQLRQLLLDASYS